MQNLASPISPSQVFYPDSDGNPMADNTLQFRWIVTLVGGLQRLFADDPDVFVAGDLLWYPVEGDNKVRIAPDALVEFGRPKGDRGSYKQWEEAGIAPQVVFEVLSPGNTPAEMKKKLEFYSTFGVEEYYLYDLDRGMLQGWLRHLGRLWPVAEMRGWISPRLGVRFDLEDRELSLTGPDGQRFESYLDVALARMAAKQHALNEAHARQIAEQHALDEARARQAAEQRAVSAEQHALDEARARQAAEQRAVSAEQHALDEARVRQVAEQRVETEARERLALEAELERLRALLDHTGS